MKKFILFLTLFAFVSVIQAQDSTAFTYSAIYTADFAAFTNTNDFSTGMLGEIDLSAELNTELAGMWKNGTFMVYVLNNHGSMPSTNTVGDLQTFSNIEASARTKLYELWYLHTTENFWLKLGMQNINADFVFSENGLNLINSSFGVIPTVSGNIPVSIFPTPSLGVSFSYNLSPEWIFRGVITDGNPGDEISDPFGVNWTLSKEDGSISQFELHKLVIAEDGETPKATIKLGYWYNSYTTPKTLLESETKNSSFGIYTINDFTISQKVDKPEEGWRGFIKAGYSLSGEIETSLGCGFSLVGVQNSNDVFSFGYTNALFNNAFKTDNNLANGEHVIEINYAFSINNNISIQPDLQYIIQTGGIKNKNDIAAFIRMSVSLDN